MPAYKSGLLIFLLFLLALLFLFAVKAEIDIGKFQHFIKNLGIFAPLTFILIYTVGTVFFMPIIPMFITAGLVFGLLWGTVYSVIGATSGACLTFLVSRYLLKDFIDNKMPARVYLIKKGIEEQGWKFIALSRINPIFPFNIQNYVFGVTNIRLKTFFWSTVLSMIPSSFAYVYVGYASSSTLAGDPAAIAKIINAIFIIMFISLLPYFIRKMKAIRNKQKIST